MNVTKKQQTQTYKEETSVDQWEGRKWWGQEGRGGERFERYKPLCISIAFPHSSVDKESSCNAGGPSSIPGWGKSAGEGIGYPPQYSWASLVAQLVKNPPARQETWAPPLGWEDPPVEGKG